MLAAWLVLASIIISLAPTLSDVSENDSREFLPRDAESLRAGDLAREAFPSSGTPAIIVLRNEAGLTEQDQAAAREIFDAVAAMQQEPDSNVNGIVSVFNVPQASAELLAPDGTAMMIIVSISGSVNDEPYLDRIERIRDVTSAHDGAELRVNVSGPGGLVADLVSVFSELDLFLLVVTASLVLVLLVLMYRAPAVAIVPLLVVGLVFQLGGGIAAYVLREIGFPVSAQSSGIMTVILFGAGTDYFLFIASRYREELRARPDKHEAIQRTMRAVSPAIISAGGTLIVASLVLLLSNLGSYRALGPIVAIAIAVMMLAALTLVPAVLAIMGRNGFWPFRPFYDPEAAHAPRESRHWSTIASRVLHAPGRVLATTSVVLVLLIGGMGLLNISYDTLESLPSNVDSVQGFEQLRASFPEGELAPTRVYIPLPEGTTIYEDGNLQRVAAVSEAIAAMPGIVAVEGPDHPFGRDGGPGPEAVLGARAAIPPGLLQQLEEAVASGTGRPSGEGEIDPGSEVGQAIGLYASSLGFVSSERDIAELSVTLGINPYGRDAMDIVPDLRDVARNAATANGLDGSAILVGGETAENADTRASNMRDYVIVLPIVLLCIILILGWLLRSAVAALYLGVTILVTYFSTLGLAVLVFRFVFGHESVGSTVPFYLFVFLNALGVDYSIYLMSRIREEYQTLDLRHAAERALVRTGGVITSAGIILAGTFAALMTLPLRDLFQLGFAVSVGVLIDTFVTRTLLVPSIVMLLGKWNWWPGRLPDHELARDPEVAPAGATPDL